MPFVSATFAEACRSSPKTDFGHKPTSWHLCTVILHPEDLVVQRGCVQAPWQSIHRCDLRLYYYGEPIDTRLNNPVRYLG
jgi:hypothetical protein